jgi:signal transduction histidine kinase/CheY-like chemotaxis protein
MLIVITLLIFVIVLFLSRRHSDRKSKLLLESQVKQRTEELQASTSALKKANKVKGEFLANMSHEIRTPLTAVMGQAEAIMHGEVEHQEVLKEVGIIYSNSLHLLALINNILDLSKVEANKLELELRQQNLHEILDQLTDIFSEQAKSKGLSFEITHQLPQPFYLLIDGLRLKQILINLCSNAIKFTANGNVKVEVLTKNDQLVFTISDTGIGLSYTQLQRIFDSFTQGDSSISRRFGGSGLGLCLSERLAKLMGGNIELDSTLGQGSIFSLILPLTSDTTQPSLAGVINDKIDQQITVVSKKPMAQFSGKVLIADDHQDNLNLIARFLQSLGLEVVTANNGKQAIEMFIQHTPQLVLLDIQMPEMDGLEAFNILRQQGCTQPIYALTANAMSHEVDTYLAKGFDGHLKKPIERSQFITTLSKVFSEANINNQQAIDALTNVDMADLIVKFKSNLVLEQEDIMLHSKNNELTHLSCISHRIAGAAQMFGYPRLSKIALELELAIKSENTAILTELSQAFLDEIEQVLW